MIHHDRRAQVFAAGLAAVAGYVDALGFIHLGGFFVSFMSGNSTRAGVGLADAGGDAVIAGALVATFVGGVVIGAVAGRLAKQHRQFAVLSLVAVLLALGALAQSIGLGMLAIAAMALAMGAENTVFERNGEVSIGVTYMTGTLVKAGQRIAAALAGEDRWGWLPYLLLWASLVTGATLGAVSYPLIGLGGLWIAAGAVALLAWVARRS